MVVVAPYVGPAVSIVHALAAVRYDDPPQATRTFMASQAPDAAACGACTFPNIVERLSVVDVVDTAEKHDMVMSQDHIDLLNQLFSPETKLEAERTGSTTW